MNDEFTTYIIGEDSKFDYTNLELYDIVVKFKITSFYYLDISETFEIPQLLEKRKTITPILPNSLKLTFYVVEICDKPIAEQLNPKMGDILLESDVYDVEFREYINPILKYEKEITFIKPLKPTKDDEILEFFLSEIASIQYQQSDNMNSNLNKKQKEELQTLYINQEIMIIKYNEIKNGIKEETEIDRLRDFQFWYMQITDSQNQIKKLKEELQKKRKYRLDFLANYAAEFNRIQQEIQNETEIEILKNFWLKEITKSKLEDEDKQKLNELREEHIRELKQTQSETNDFNQIRDGICDEPHSPSLKVNR
ncbi:4111_t:CDS:2 [Cetraspora pellucida]|uniref:4111_t:CDS:1 n=1 Tax=Cetraspora pellucida TaxID=1433469 RepID=A0A9N9N7Z3_9GLOM|nr:4111_t:CDS:2 [Cetraspora pellucida]